MSNMSSSSESLREREAYRFTSWLIKNARARPIAVATIGEAQCDNLNQTSVCADNALTAFAQLTTYRLNAARCLISTFDRKNQYIVAEATTDTPIAPEVNRHHDLCTCGIATPRSSSLCEHVLVAIDGDSDGGNSQATGELPISVIPDSKCDTRFSNRCDIQEHPYNRFYAGVPIRSPRGINIGVLCVFDDKPRVGLDSGQKKFLRDMSCTIMQHWESRATAINFNKSVRMVKALGSFVEGEATMSQWRPDVDTEPSEDWESEEELDEKQQVTRSWPDQLNAESGEDQPHRPDPTPLQSQSGPTQDGSSSTIRSGQSLGDNGAEVERTISGAMSVNTNVSAIRTNASVPAEEPVMKATQEVFSRAANIIREAVEVEGVMFLDARVGSFGGLVPNQDTCSSGSSDPSLSTLSSESGRIEVLQDINHDNKMCGVLGYSTSTTSSVDDKSILRSSEISIPEKFLRILLRRYPSGKVYNFDEDGSYQSTDEEAPIPQEAMCPSGPSSSESRRKSDNPFSKKNEAKTLKSLFPGVCSVALVPLWDSRRERWFAGSVLWSKKHTRSFTTKDDLSYLRAFGFTIMAEITSIDSSLAEKATCDLLGSLSHELRSPLHGVIAAVELLQDTDIDVYQGNLVHTMESCGRTLLDSIDHLLDYTKINRLVKQTRRNADLHATGSEQLKSFQSQITHISSTTELATLAEETVESIFAGHNFHKMSIAQLIHHEKAQNRDVGSLRRLDSAQAIETFSIDEVLDLPTALVDGDQLSVYLDIDPNQPWLWHITPGAVRRIIMNLLGNSLKFTKRGFIVISLKQEHQVSKNGRDIANLILNVTDSGRGIAADFLMNHAFKPFSKEDPLSPGTGLGLSIVHQITKSLGGTVSIESQLQCGTSVTVKVPLRTPSTGLQMETSFSEHIKAIGGLKAVLLGFENTAEALGISAQHPPVEAEIMRIISQDWLHLNVISSDSSNLRPDITICTDSYVSSIGLASPTESQPPTVVVCRNAVAAHSLSERYSSAYGKVICEFISQPVGPRKLSSAIVLALGKYKDFRQSELLTVGSTISSQSVSDMSSNVSSTTPTPLTEQMTPLLDVPEVEDYLPSKMTLPHRPSKTEAETTTKQSDEMTSIPPAATSDPIVSITPATPTPGAIPQAPSTDRDIENNERSGYLIVDDNDINLRILASFMKKLNYSYKTATNGLEALEAYAAAPGKYGHILMDLSMPVMDGMESTRRIRELERAQQIEPACIIALTGLASADAQQEAFASGINLYMMKPVRFKELAKVLNKTGN